MSYANWSPVLPLEAIDDSNRIMSVNSTIWNLEKIKIDLQSSKLILAPTIKASNEMAIELNWDHEDLESFIKCLYSGRQVNQQWCKTPAGSEYHPADAYSMGFNRIKKEENQNMSPLAYVKFAVKQKSLIVFSAHRDRYSN